MSVATAPTGETAVLHVGGLHYAGEKLRVEHALGARPGVLAVEANPVAQTATVTYDPAQTSVEALARWVEECGYHCAGQSVPGHVCDPMAEYGAAPAAHDHAAMERAEHAHGHGHGGHAGMSMEAMVRDMRNRFLVALVFTIPIVLWSSVGTNLIGSPVATPFDIDREVWQFLLSLPIVFYASTIFFTGAVSALRNRTLDMMVLVAVAIGTAWLYSVAATFFIEGDVFYESAGMLATFVLLGHWFEMRAAAAPTTPSARCWSWRRRARWCCAMGSRSRCPRPRSSWGTCCWSARARRSPSTGRWRTATPRSTSRWLPGRACRCTRRLAPR